VAADTQRSSGRMFIPHHSVESNSPRSPTSPVSSQSDSSFHSVSSLSPRNNKKQRKQQEKSIPLNTEEEEEENYTLLETEITFNSTTAPGKIIPVPNSATTVTSQPPAASADGRSVSTASATAGDDGWNQYRTTSVVSSSPTSSSAIPMLPRPPSAATPASTNAPSMPSSTIGNITKDSTSEMTALQEEESEILQQLESALLSHQQNKT
jgi:hypothetical protein